MNGDEFFQGLGAGFTGGFIVGCIISLIVFTNTGLINMAGNLKEECEADLARDLKCEMVYLKPDTR